MSKKEKEKRVPEGTGNTSEDQTSAHRTEENKKTTSSTGGLENDFQDKQAISNGSEEFNEKFYELTQIFRVKRNENPPQYNEYSLTPNQEEAQPFQDNQTLIEEFEEFDEDIFTLTKTFKVKAEEKPPQDQHTPAIKREERKAVPTVIQSFDIKTSEFTDSIDWNVGDIIDGKYEVLEVLGQGAMGIVYKVHHREWDIDLAVKMPLPQLIANEVLKARFVLEAQTWVDLGLHPNIVQCWYVREFGGIPRVFMDYLDGGSLKDWIKTGKVRPGKWANILDLVIQACDGLGYAHEHGMEAHRDVKPGNMLLSEDGELRVTDFGIAKRGKDPDIEGKMTVRSSSGNQHTLTTTDSGMGTPEYGAPEQWSDARYVDAQVDIYALGGILFELCCGRRPFDDGRHKAKAHVLIGRHWFFPVPDPREFNKNIPQALAELIVQCLAKEPKDRPDSMAELRERLVRIYGKVVGKPYWREIPQAAELRSSALNNRAVSLLDLGKKKEAVATLDDALKFDAHHAESVYNKSLLEWRDEIIADDEVVRRLKEAKQTSWRAGLYLGFIHMERAAADEAEQELVEALQDRELTKNGSAWRSLGDALMAQRKYSEAEEAYQKALELIPGDDVTSRKKRLAHKKTCRENGRVVFPWPRCLRTLVGLETRPDTVMLTSDGHFALLGTSEEMRLWNLEKGRFFWKFTWSDKMDLWTFRGFANNVTSIAITSDGKFVVSGGNYDRNIRLWNIETGKCVRSFEGHEKGVSAVALTPDGQWAVSGSLDKTLRIWELSTGACLQILEGHEKEVNAAAVTPDGQFVLSGGESFLRVWDMTTGKYLRRFRGHRDDVNAVVMTPDGQFVVSGSRDKTLRLWKFISGKCLRIFTGHTGWVTTIAITADGRFAVSGSLDKTLRIWRLATGKCLQILKGHKSAVTAVAITPDGRLVISASRDKTLRLWSLTTGKCLKTLKEYTYWLEALALTPDGRFAIVGNNDEMRLKDLGTGTYLRAFARSEGDERKTVTSSAQATVPGTEANTVRLQEFPPGECFLTVKGQGNTKTAVAVTLNGRFALSGTENETLRLWDILSEKCFWIFRGPRGLQVFKKHRNWINCLAVTLDERFAVSGWTDSSVRLWDLTTGKCLQVFEGHGGIVTAVALTLDGRFAMSGSLDMTLRVWDLRTGKGLQTLEGHEGAVTAVAMTPDARYAISGSTDKTLRLWDLRLGKCLRTFKEHEESLTAVAITPDGQFALSVSNDKTLRLWVLDLDIQRTGAAFQVCRQREHWEVQSFRKQFRKYLNQTKLAIRSGKAATAYTFLALARTIPGYERDPEALKLNATLGRILQRKSLREGQLLRILEGHEGTVTSVALTTDGRFAISGSKDYTLRLWTLTMGKCVRIFKGHKRGVACVALSPNRHFAVSGSWDKTLRLWAIATGECLKTFKEHEDDVRSAAITPDGFFALSGSSDKTLRLWPLVTKKHLQIFEGLIVPLEDAYKSAELTVNKSLRTFKGHEGTVAAVAITRDGRFAVSGSWDNTLRLWNLATGKCLQVFKGHTNYVTAVTIMPDRQFAISGSRDRTLRLWNLKTGKCVRIFRGHVDYVSAVTITSDGHFAISASWDRTLRLWKLETGECIRVFERHQEIVETVAITLDGHFVISGSRDKTLQMWEFDWQLAPVKALKSL